MVYKYTITCERYKQLIMIVVNLVGSPCVGKSTMASKLFYKLKVKGYRVELINEYAKELLYEDSNRIQSQIEVFSEQLLRQRRLIGKVDILITDSPILLSIIYNNEPNPHLNDLIAWEFKSFDNLVYFLDRGDIKYENEGRFQNEEEAKVIDTRIIDLMDNLDVDYTKLVSRTASTRILCDIEERVALMKESIWSV
jgi:GTPase SAR1 family protein